MSNKQRQEYRIAGQKTWELVRKAYLDGASARECAERFGLSEHGIRKRISKEGWTKRDYARALEVRRMREADEAAWEAPACAPPPPARLFDDYLASPRAADAPAPGPAPETLERAALNSLGAALAKGRAADARAFVGVAEAMRKRANETRSSDEARTQAAASDNMRQTADKEQMAIDIFRLAAHLANCIVHAPDAAPAIFVDLIAEMRRHFFGEGDEAALAAAKRDAQYSRRYFQLSEEAWQKALDEAVRDGRENLS